MGQYLAQPHPHKIINLQDQTFVPCEVFMRLQIEYYEEKLCASIDWNYLH